MFGPNCVLTAVKHFDYVKGKDGDSFPIGHITLTLISTPGHTIDSCCYILKDTFKKEKALFSGDTLLLTGLGSIDTVASPDHS